MKTVYDLPAPSDYWKKPDAPETGDPQEIGLFIGVGVALTEWENLEQSMAELFSWFVESKSHAGARAYGFAVAGKNDFIQGAAEVFFDRNYVSDEHKKEFKILMNHKQCASGFRNEIAHGRVIGMTFNDKHFGKFLMSPDYNSRKTTLPFSSFDSENPLSFLFSKYRYTASILSELTAKFIALRDVATEYKYLLANNYRHEAWSVERRPPPPLPPAAP